MYSGRSPGVPKAPCKAPCFTPECQESQWAWVRTPWLRRSRVLDVTRAKDRETRTFGLLRSKTDILYYNIVKLGDHYEVTCFLVLRNENLNYQHVTIVLYVNHCDIHDFAAFARTFDAENANDL